MNWKSVRYCNVPSWTDLLLRISRQRPNGSASVEYYIGYVDDRDDIYIYSKYGQGYEIVCNVKNVECGIYPSVHFVNPQEILL